MPLHDWTRVDAGIFHDFHLAWIAEMRRVLNGGLLPQGYYALAEQVGGGNPDVLKLNTPQASPVAGEGRTALLAAPRQTRVVARFEQQTYSARQRQLAIRHTSGHQVVALIELVTSGNKAGVRPYRAFLDKLFGALEQGVHLLVIDPYPPTNRDLNGIHGDVWGELTGEDYATPADADRTQVSYMAGTVKTAYVEPVAVGQALREMPLFLTPEGEWQVEVPLEATYLAAYDGLPQFYRDILKAPAT